MLGLKSSIIPYYFKDVSELSFGDDSILPKLRLLVVDDFLRGEERTLQLALFSN